MQIYTSIHSMDQCNNQPYLLIPKLPSNKPFFYKAGTGSSFNLSYYMYMTFTQ